MNNWQMRLSYRTDSRKKSIGSYELEISETDDPLEPMTQRGPVKDNRVTYWGVYSTAREAAVAAGDYIDAAGFVIYSSWHPADCCGKTYNLGNSNLKHGAETGAGIVEIIYRKTPLSRRDE